MLQLSDLKIAVIGIDASSDAITLAHQNAIALDLSDAVQFIQSDWYTNIPKEWLGRFDLILLRNLNEDYTTFKPIYFKIG